MTSFSEFKPLVGAFGTVCLLALILTFLMAEPKVSSFMSAFMASFFLVFGGLKAYNLDGFVEAFRSYDLLAERSITYARAYPFLELSLSLGYFLVLAGLIGGLAVNLATIVLMAVGSLGVFNALASGRDLNCACLGNVFELPMTKVTLAEDLGMAGMAALMILF